MPLLDTLVATHFLRFWAHGSVPGDLHWEFARHNHLTGDYSCLDSVRGASSTGRAQDPRAE